MEIKIGFLEILGLVFIILRLIGVIHWGWLWVASPFILSIIIQILIILYIIFN